LKAVFVTGTAGAGKSLLTKKLLDYYASNGAFSAALNLDPGVEGLPYAPDIDVRDHVDLVAIMKQYDLGPNGALVMASDLAASKFEAVHEQVQEVNPDYLVVDTPGQVELFAYRSSGPFMVDRMEADQKASVFLFDGALVTSPVNFVSVSLLAASIRLRLGLPSIGALAKSDMIGDRIDSILGWASDPGALSDAISKEAGGETYELASAVLRGMDMADAVHRLVPLSSTTGEGLADLEGALSRTVNQGEEVED